MKIWVDADACPRVIRDILFRAAERKRLPMTLVANQSLTVPPSPFVDCKRVPGGFDEADRYIEENCAADDLVITADIPLAAAVVERGATALNPRGQVYTRENVRERLAVRDMMEELRSTRQVSGGPAALGAKDKQTFANALDRLLAACRTQA